jgi:hypothetical protein
MLVGFKFEVSVRHARPGAGVFAFVIARRAKRDEAISRRMRVWNGIASLRLQ